MNWKEANVCCPSKERKEFRLPLPGCLKFIFYFNLLLVFQVFVQYRIKIYMHLQKMALNDEKIPMLPFEMLNYHVKMTMLPPVINMYLQKIAVQHSNESMYRLEIAMYHLEMNMYRLEISMYRLEMDMYGLEISMYRLEMDMYHLEMDMYQGQGLFFPVHRRFLPVRRIFG